MLTIDNIATNAMRCMYIERETDVVCMTERNGTKSSAIVVGDGVVARPVATLSSRELDDGRFTHMDAVVRIVCIGAAGEMSAATKSGPEFFVDDVGGRTSHLQTFTSASSVEVLIETQNH